MVIDDAIQAVSSVPQWVENLDSGWGAHCAAVEAFNQANRRAHGHFAEVFDHTSPKSAEELTVIEAQHYLIDQIVLKCQKDFVSNGVALNIDIGEWKNHFSKLPVSDFSPCKLYELLAEKYLGGAGCDVAVQQAVKRLADGYSRRIGTKIFKDSVKFTLRGIAEDPIFARVPSQVYYSYHSRESLKPALKAIKSLFVMDGFEFDPDNKLDTIAELLAGFTSERQVTTWGTAHVISDHLTLTARKNGIEVKLSHEAFKILNTHCKELSHEAQ